MAIHRSIFCLSNKCLALRKLKLWILQMQDEKLLENSFEAIFESSMDCVKIISVNATLERMNHHGCHLMEVEDLDEVVGMDWFSYWNPEILPVVEKAFNETLKGKRSKFTGMCKTAKGNAKWWDVTLTPILDKEGKVAHILSISKDITKLIVQNQTLEEFKARLDLAVEVGEVVVWDWNLDDDYMIVSDSKNNVLGFNERSLTLKPDDFFDRIDPVDRNRIVSEFDIAKNDNLSFSSDFRYNKSPTQSVILSLSASYSATGENGRWIGIIRDITSQIDEKSALKLNEKKASEANQIKSQFVTNVSHELRTPMNSIIGYADLLYELHKDRESSSKEYSTQIKKSGEYLLRLLNDILDISKMEAGQLIIEEDEINLSRVMSESIGVLKIQADQKNIDLKFERGPNVPSCIQTDESRFKQVVINLVGNAIKFTSKGSVKVNLTFEYETEKTGILNIVVSDTGIGIPQRKQEKLFSPFSQADESIYRQFGGTGLGLHLSRMITEALGGSLDLLDSEAGKGSTFRFSLSTQIGTSEKSFSEKHNLKANSKKQQVVEDLGFLKDKKILVADDVIENRRLLKLFLIDSGANIIFAEDGLDVINKCSKTTFDFIFMDVMMPNLSGIEATRKLRNVGHTVPIVALTAHAMKNEVAACIAAGCNSHLAKPVRKEQIVNCLHEYLS